MKKRTGLTLIEIMIVVSVIAILAVLVLFAVQRQLAKGRDARRKADIKKIQNVLEDYLNDFGCYPEEVACGSTEGTSLEGYIAEIPCDPINNSFYNYFFSHDDASCLGWYKVYARLENEEDPIVQKVGCLLGCGPSNNYNYWTGSTNVAEVGQLPGEDWPVIPGVTPPGGGTPSPGATPTATETPTGGAPTATSTPTGGAPTATSTPPGGGSSPTPTATPTCSAWFACDNGECKAVPPGTPYSICEDDTCAACSLTGCYTYPDCLQQD